MQEHTPLPVGHSYLDADDLVSGLKPPIDIARLARRYGMSVHLFKADSQAWEGVVFWDHSEGVPALGINERSDLPRVRRRFTLAHEMAHVALNSAKLERAESDVLTGNSEKEREANQFASRVLVPRQSLSFSDWDAFDEPTVHKLAQSYDISSQAMAIAIVEVSQNRAVMYVQANKIVWIWLGHAFPKLRLESGDELPEIRPCVKAAEAADRWLMKPGYNLMIDSITGPDSRTVLLTAQGANW